MRGAADHPDGRSASIATIGHETIMIIEIARDYRGNCDNRDYRDYRGN
ncbi:MAG: hypothetical protein LUD17_13565 [Bacteroidales bacterium]|nr:hypothetical protein [Bacteroidales bacterium]